VRPGLARGDDDFLTRHLGMRGAALALKSTLPWRLCSTPKESSLARSTAHLRAGARSAPVAAEPPGRDILNDECGMMNDELKAGGLQFIIHHSAFIICVY
jgi:hypothetical protein